MFSEQKARLNELTTETISVQRHPAQASEVRSGSGGLGNAWYSCGYIPPAPGDGASGSEEDPYEAAKNSALLLVLTDWPEYRDLDFDLIGGAMERKTILDGRRSVDRNRLVGLGFDVHNIG